MKKPKQLLKIPLDGKGPKETERAYGIEVNNTTVWLPKSQTEDWAVADDHAAFWLPEWLIAEKGLDMFIDTSYEPSLFD